MAKKIRGDDMEAHFLEGFVKGEPGFAAEPWYNPHGDCVTFAVADEARVADRIDGVLTIYRSAIDNRPIGYQIKGVLAIVRRFGLGGVSIESIESDDRGGKLLSVSMLLLAAYEAGPRNVFRREAYTTALEQSPPARFKMSDFVPA